MPSSADKSKKLAIQNAKQSTGDRTFDCHGRVFHFSFHPRAIMHNRGSSWPVATSTCCTRRAKSLVGAKLRHRSRGRMVGGRTLWKKEATRRFRGGFPASRMGWETRTRVGRESPGSDFSFARSFGAAKISNSACIVLCAWKRCVGINIDRPRNRP